MFIFFSYGTPYFSFIFIVNQKHTFKQQYIFLTGVYTIPYLLNSPIKDEPIETKIIFFGGQNMVSQTLFISLIIFGNFLSPLSIFNGQIMKKKV